ncbi:MAG: YqgE/AlgH family protein [Proteobacteria bacterium]|nr:YqgE/AlgH family protein [Pseudomonadota bacterium]
MKKIDATNHFLMATSGGSSSSLFANSIIYICRHDESGAFGIIINKPSKTRVVELLKSLKISGIKDQGQMIMHGGPVKQEQVFILHSCPNDYEVTIKVGDEIGVTLSRDILTAIAEKRAPEKMLFACGYAGWESGQLEEEIIENSWLVLPAAADIIFDIPPPIRLEEATRRFGFELDNFSGMKGHA